MISKDKKALLHVGRQKLGWTDQEYRHVLIEHTGKLSSADPKFTDADFKKVIDHMKALGFWVVRRKAEGVRREAGELPTPDQLRVIEHLWADLAQYIGGARSGKFRQGFYEKRIRISRLGPQTRAEANHVIEVLKRRVQSEMRKAVQGSMFKVQGPEMGAKEPA